MRGLLSALVLALTTGCLEDDPPVDPSDPGYCPTVEVFGSFDPVRLVRQGDICVVPGSGNGGPSPTGGGSSGGLKCEEIGLTECSGSCADTRSSRLNCGGCGVVCPSSGFCIGGSCTD